MKNSTIVKWAIAALLAVPAMPLLATTISHKPAKPLSTPVHTIKKTSSRKLTASAKYRRPHHVAPRNTLASSKKFTHPMIGSGRPAVRTAHAAIKPSSKTAARTTRTAHSAPLARATHSTASARIARATPSARVSRTTSGAKSRIQHAAPTPAANVIKVPPMIDGLHA